MRAAHRVVARDPDWQEWAIGTLGQSCYDSGSRNVGLFFYNMASVEGYALARLIADEVCYKSWQSSPMRRREVWDFAQLRAMLDQDAYRPRIAPGGSWWRFVEIHKVECAGDDERAKQLKVEVEESLAQ